MVQLLNHSFVCHSDALHGTCTCPMPHISNCISRCTCYFELCATDIRKRNGTHQQMHKMDSRKRATRSEGMMLKFVGVKLTCSSLAGLHKLSISNSFVWLRSQCLESVAAQLSAAVYALVGGMLARFHDGPGYVGRMYQFNFARWGLEGVFYFYRSPRMQTPALPLYHCQNFSWPER